MQRGYENAINTNVPHLSVRLERVRLARTLGSDGEEAVNTVFAAPP